MSLYLDKKYINLVSTSLEKFKWKKMNLANCRCPICGDSETSRTKARGYFFSSDNSYFFKCHNCGAAYNIYKFLEIVSPVLFQEYSLEKFTNKNQKLEEIKPVVKIEKTSMPQCEAIEDLPDDHKVIEFLKSRKIPKNQWNKFAYTDHFSEFANKLNSDYNLIDDERIIIPIYDEHNQIIGAQGRAFGNGKPKYITIKKDESIRLTYGLNTVNKSKPILVVEGPIDSMFLSNSIACLGVGNFLEVREKFQNQDLIFVVDNEPRNKAVVDVVKNLIDNNEKVCIFPDNIKEKDINDMVLQGLDVCDMISKCAYRGPSAMLAFNSWRRC